MNRLAALLMTTAAFVGAFAACGGDDTETQTVQPQTRGERGESCEARNDCEAGLACINHTCSKNDFDVESTAKHCDRVDCSTSADCCGERPTEAPAKCANRAVICGAPSLPGCSATSCESNVECGSGECGTGQCSNTFSSCNADDDCSDTCNTTTGYCRQQTNRACTTSASCTGTCNSRRCDCENPAYDPSDPICRDSDCSEDVCRLKCENEACVADVSCERDVDCLSSGAGRYCESGACVACRSDEECGVEGQSCVDNRCKAACTQNEECPLFHACDSGSCVETGCTSDRECILAVGRNEESGEDARLAKCLPSAANANVKECKIPCENDGACGSELEVCEAGFCKFVGCDTDEECRSYLGLADQTTSNPSQPWISKAVCRD